MLSGKVYKRAISLDTTADYIKWMQDDFGDTILSNIISSISQHIDYRKDNAVGLKKLLDHLIEDKSGSSTYDALNDLENQPSPSLTDRASYIATRYTRNSALRNTIRERSKGYCEHCGKKGFLTIHGEHYVEVHHIIALANDGEDRITNLIALCPEHHRQAHYAADADQLEKTFVSSVERILNNNIPN